MEKLRGSTGVKTGSVKRKKSKGNTKDDKVKKTPVAKGVTKCEATGLDRRDNRVDREWLYKGKWVKFVNLPSALRVKYGDWSEKTANQQESQQEKPQESAISPEEEQEINNIIRELKDLNKSIQANFEKIASLLGEM